MSVIAFTAAIAPVPKDTRTDTVPIPCWEVINGAPAVDSDLEGAGAGRRLNVRYRIHRRDRPSPERHPNRHGTHTLLGGHQRGARGRFRSGGRWRRTPAECPLSHSPPRSPQSRKTPEPTRYPYLVGRSSTGRPRSIQIWRALAPDAG